VSGFTSDSPAKALLTRASLAQRTDRIEPFRVMELVKRAVALEAQGRSIVHLSIGERTSPRPRR